MTNRDTLKKLNSLFGSYKAEWLKDKVFELFAEPSYFTALQDNRPCVLEGGRGTGKTTVLRGLSYQGQYALHKEDIHEFDKGEFIGIYHRVNTNHVRAFTGGDLEVEKWKKVFGHYFNLMICRELIKFLEWHGSFNSNAKQLPSETCDIVGRALNISVASKDQQGLLSNINVSMAEFQSQINNISDGNIPRLSMSGEPINVLTHEIVSLPQFQDKIVFIILDEYENYEDYQQQIVNTLLKHNTEDYTFKIGVRELGWRVKHTLNPSELLYDPADYVLIEVEQKLEDSHFSKFAKNVCEQRMLQLLATGNGSPEFIIEKALGQLSHEDEALMLGIKNTRYFKDMDSLSKKYKDAIDHLSPLYQYFISYWATWHDMSLEFVIDDYLQSISRWNTRYENYKYEMLFKIKKGRGKGGIQKYYCGWDTYIKLSRGNIRYLMELVYKAYERHLNEDKDLREAVDCKTQTLAAQDVGQKNLMELEGLWKNGAQLTKLLLGFGRIFQVLSKSEGKSAPEKNQFSIENSSAISEKCSEILTASVMNLALVRTPGNKLTDTSHTRDFLYTIHPIYSAFFVFSYRRKRKIMVSQEDILGVISSPKETISKILKSCKVNEEDNYNLPSQLSIFEEYYND